MTTKKIKYCLTVLLLSSVTMFGQELSGISGSFVDLGFGTRASGMGNAFTAQSDDANSVFWNPGGLVASEKIKIDFNYINQLGIIPYSSLGAVIPIGKKDAVGAGLIYSGDAALKELTFVAGYARKLGDLTVGANLKYRYASFGKNNFSAGDYTVFDNGEITEGEQNKIFGSGNGFGMDLGVKYSLSKSVTLGLVVKDILSPFYWNSENKNTLNPARGEYNEAMPIKTIAGFSFNSHTGFIVNGDYQPAILKDEINVIRFGAEYTVFDIISFRAGTQQFINSLPDEKYSFGVGFAYGLGGLKVLANYAYVLEQLANTSRFSIGVNF